jgi:Spy/CpxP family protein refolding chaperone
MQSKTFVISVAIAVAIAASAALAQHRGGHHAQPYAGQQTREIASLSPEELEGFLQGRGMGLARSAELNGYPGPMHVLELDKALGLTADQRRRVQDVFDRMKVKATEVGRKYLAAERALDAAFKSGSADQATVAALVAEAHRLLGEVRLAHLAAHIEIRPLLAPEQRARYAELRGYAHDKGHNKH